MARDDFSKTVIDKLKSRVAHRCSNPGCRVPTSAPSENDRVNNIGIAAHICAASPGGARYDKSTTSEERKSIDNAIWLCSNCSIDIDRDESRHPVNILKKWKSKAEDSARIELGKKPPNNNETIDTVAMALTGFPKNYIVDAISNIHQATSKSLESLDQRFLVKTAHDNEKTSIGIYAKENVSLSMKISGEIANEYIEKYRQLLEHGKDIEIESGGISIEGSKLFEEVFGDNNGVFSVLSKRLKATQKLWLVQDETKIVESFDDIQGSISFGTKSFTFTGTACNELFNFSYQKSLDENNDKANITLSLCLDQWEGVNLKFLPYLDKILSLFSKMVQGWKVFTSLEINGIKILSSIGVAVNKWDYALDTSSLLHYVNSCRIISDTMHHDVSFTSNIAYTSEEHKYITDVVEIIEGKKVYNADNITSNPTCDLIVDDECKNIQILAESSEPNSVRIVQQAGEEIKLFGVSVHLHQKIISLNSVLPKIHGETENLKSGDTVKVEWIPQKDFKCTVSYESY